MMQHPKVLVVDDEAQMLENLERMLSADGFTTRTLQDPTRFRTVRAEFSPDVLITDLHMPNADGMTLLAASRADDPALPVILITGYATVSSAVDAMHEGAFDYLAKPFTGDQLRVAVERAVRHRVLVQENTRLKARLNDGIMSRQAIGVNPAFTRLIELATRVAQTDANVLITGESGTGKELLARMIHERSRRADRPYVPVDCAALPDALLESELFGHEKGAFTGAVARRKGLIAEADGGTVFFDEVGEMSVALQSKLLRALEQKQVRPLGESSYVDVDVRIVAATNRDLVQGVRDGEFREDLYYRLNVVHFRMPPLRDRQEDIPLLATRFMQEFCATSGKQAPRITAEVWSALERYSWPGNIRQLRNVIQRLIALDDDGRLTASDLPPELRGIPVPPLNGSAPSLAENVLVYEEARQIAQREFLSAYVERLLAAHDGNISKAAKSAGVSRRSLHRWLADLGRTAAFNNGIEDEQEAD